METASIKQLKDIKGQMRESLRKISTKDYGAQKFGGEKEYTAKGLVAGVDALATDIGGLIRAPKRFIQLSSHAERQNLVNQFTNLKNHVDAKNLPQIATILEQIKPLLRAYGVRISNGRQEEFLSHVDDMQRRCESLREYIDILSKKKTEAESLNSSIEDTYSELSKKLDDLEERNKTIQNIFDESQSNSEKVEDNKAESTESLDEIKNLLADAKGSEQVISQFSKRVEQREKQLEKQEVATGEYNKSLKDYEKKHNSILNEARDLIESAKMALDYKTAEGISAAFTEKYNESKSDKTTYIWVGVSGLFLIAAISIGVWIVWEKDLNIESIIGRLSLIPILIGASWFSASQYIKQRNLAEDYAYKSVLAKSIVGFSEQLSSDTNKGEEYSHYIKSVLSEMHNDPLRKHGAKQKDTEIKPKDIESLIKDIEMVKSISKKFS